MEKTVIIGCGDLGSPLANTTLKAGLYPVIYDRDAQAIKRFEGTCRYTRDPSLLVDNQSLECAYSVCDDPKNLADIDGIVNFAVPASSLEAFPALGNAQLGIMHDSVMTSSYTAIQERDDSDRRKYSIAHLLMNQHDRAILDPEHGDVHMVKDYLQRLGLNVLLMSYREHDQMMACSQGAMLKLMVRYGHTLRLLQAAQILKERPILRDLNHSLLARNAQWTDATIMSIMRNPHVDLEHEDVVRFIDRKHRIKGRTPQGRTLTFFSELMETDASVEEADRIEAEFTDFAQANVDTLTAMNQQGLLTPSSEELLSLLMRNTVLVT